MAKGLEQKLLFTITVDQWFRHFLVAIYTVDPIWTKAYRLNKLNEIDDSMLSYRTLANDFWREL